MLTRTIDWESIHRRLAIVGEAISGTSHAGPDETHRILEARARRAAQPSVEPDQADQIEILAFTLASEQYGVETGHVLEVCALAELTAVPCTPPFVAGVMNLRGRILAILDLRRLFELPAGGLTELNRVIVLKGGGDELGLLADSIVGVRSIAMSELQEGLPTLTGIRDKFLKGITGMMLAVLDGSRLLSDASLKINEQVTR
jgi:purine-binding chemotaxis protein CheW